LSRCCALSDNFLVSVKIHMFFNLFPKTARSLASLTYSAGTEVKSTVLEEMRLA